MERILCGTLALLVPLAATAAAPPVAKAMTDRAVLQAVPMLPGTADDAYALYVDHNGSLTSGAALETADEDIAGATVGGTPAGPVGMPPDVQHQMAMAQQMQQRYGSPEGQAQLKSMSPAQLMAMAQQMQPNSPPGAMPVSDHDSQLMKRMQAETDAADKLELNMQVGDWIQKASALGQQWDAELKQVSVDEQRELNKLPAACKGGGDIAFPNPAEERAIVMKYADKRIQIAQQYLRKFQPLEHTMRTEVGQFVDHLDDNVVLWTQLDSPALKQKVDPQVHGALSGGLAFVGNVNGVVKDVTRRAAQAVADKKRADQEHKGGPC